MTAQSGLRDARRRPAPDRRRRRRRDRAGDRASGAGVYPDAGRAAGARRCSTPSRRILPISSSAMGTRADRDATGPDVRRMLDVSVDRVLAARRARVAIAEAARDARRPRADRRRLGARPAARPRRRRTRPRGLRHPGRRAAALLERVRPRRSRSARASRSTSSATSTCRCRGASRSRAAATRGFDVTGDPSMSIEEAARRRDFTINAISWDPLTDEYLDPFDGRARSRAPACCASSIPRTFGDDSLRVLRALQFAARFELTLDDETRGDLPGDSARRPAGRADLGRIREAAARRRRPSIGFALALELGVVERLFPELQRARRLPAGARVASRRRRLGAHAAGDRPGAARGSTTSTGRSGSRSCSARSATTSASRRRPRSSTAASARSITRSRASRRRTAFLDRLNVHSIDGYDVRAPGARHGRRST